MFIFAKNFIITTLFGTAFISAAPLLILLSIGYFLYVFYLPTIRIYELYRMNSSFLIICFVSVVSCVLLNFVLASHYTSRGSSIATLISISLMSLMLCSYLYIARKIHPFSKQFLLMILLNAVLFIPLYFIYKSFMAPTAINLSIIGVFFGVLYSFGSYLFILDKTDKGLISHYYQKATKLFTKS
jgi:O-antigen/teichoic acid export membrane protein